MRGNRIIAAVAAATGLATAADAAIFTGLAAFRSAQTGFAPAGDALVLSGPGDSGFASWFGHSSQNQPGMYAFASSGSELSATSISAVGETFVSSGDTSRRIGSRSAVDFIFTLDEAAVVTIFAQAGGNFGGATAIRAYLGTSTDPIIDTTSGFVTFTDQALAAGTYIMSFEILTIIDGEVGTSNGYYNVSVAVPGPGGVALLGLAAVVGSRRRRGR